MTEITPEQIEAKAREIGGRPYYSSVIESDRFFDANLGVSIRQELMRTAMGGLLTRTPSHGSELGILELNRIVDESSIVADKLLLQMAKDELGVE